MKKGKTFLIFTLSLSLFLGCSPVADSGSDTTLESATGSNILESQNPEQEISGSIGLEYLINADGNSYSVTGKGVCTDTEIIIPTTHNQKPITTIAEEAFAYIEEITSVEVPSSVFKIEPNAFFLCSSLEKIIVQGNSSWMALASALLISGETVDMSDPVQTSTLLTTTYRNYYLVRN